MMLSTRFSILAIGTLGLAAAGATPAFAQQCQSVEAPEPLSNGNGSDPSAAASSVGTRASFLFEHPADYVIGADDTLSIRFWREDQMNADVVVRPDGKITLPLINDIQAAGLTPIGLCNAITDAAKRLLAAPVVSVIVKEIKSRKVFIIGQVSKPGSYDMTGQMTVVHLLTMAGGLGEFAKAEDITVLRTEGGKHLYYRVNYKDISRGRNLSQNIALKPGDTIIVRSPGDRPVLSRSSVVAPVLLVGLSAPAYAQSPPQQAPRPIFGGGVSRIAQSLSLGGSLGHSVFVAERRLIGEDTDTRQQSQFTSASGSLSYGLEGSRAGASAALSSSGNYYAEISDEIIRGYSGVTGAWLRISNRTRLDGSHTVTYQPAYQNAFQQLLDPTFVPIAPPPDVAASDELWLSHDSRVSLSHQLSRRSSFTLDYGRREVDFSSTDARQVQHSAGARYTHQLTAGLGFRLGYRYSTGDAQGDSNRRSGLHTIDAGLDFSRAFSVTRRTTLSFSTGSSVVQTADDSTQFFVTGTGTLSHRIGRSWSASLTGGRDVSFVDGLGDPVLSDRVMGGVTGGFGRRVRTQASVTAMRGQLLAGADQDETFLVYTGSAGASVALTRAVSWIVSYAYQDSDYGEVNFLSPQQLQAFHNATTGISVSAWRYLSFNANYAYTTVARGSSGTAPPKYRRQSVVFSIGTSLPLYATVRK